MRGSDPGDRAQLAAHLVHQLLGEPGGDPGPEGQLVGGLHEGTPFVSLLLAGHAPLANQELQAVTAGWQVFDPVHRPGLDPGGQHPAGRTGSFGRYGFDKYLSPGRFVGRGDDAVVGEVQQNRRGIDWPGILEHGS